MEGFVNTSCEAPTFSLVRDSWATLQADAATAFAEITDNFITNKADVAIKGENVEDNFLLTVEGASRVHDPSQLFCLGQPSSDHGGALNQKGHGLKIFQAETTTPTSEIDDEEDDEITVVDAAAVSDHPSDDDEDDEDTTFVAHPINQEEFCTRKQTDRLNLSIAGGGTIPKRNAPKKKRHTVKDMKKALRGIVKQYKGDFASSRKVQIQVDLYDEGDPPRLLIQDFDQSKTEEEVSWAFIRTLADTLKAEEGRSMWKDRMKYRREIAGEVTYAALRDESKVQDALSHIRSTQGAANPLKLHVQVTLPPHPHGTPVAASAISAPAGNAGGGGPSRGDAPGGGGGNASQSGGGGQQPQSGGEGGGTMRHVLPLLHLATGPIENLRKAVEAIQSIGATHPAPSVPEVGSGTAAASGAGEGARAASASGSAASSGGTAAGKRKAEEPSRPAKRRA